MRVTPEARPQARPGLSRSDFLKLAGAAVGGVAVGVAVDRLNRRLAALTQILEPSSVQATLVPEATLTNVPEATIAPSPTSTPESGLEHPASAELLGLEVEQYANAWDFSQPEVLSRVAYQEFRDLAGSPFRVAFDTATSIPLLITNKDRQWQAANLKELAAKTGVNVGVVLETWNFRFLEAEFNFAMIPSSWPSNQLDSSESYKFDWEDEAIRLSQLRGIENFRLMHLVMSHGGMIPQWVRDGGYSREQLIQILTNYITTTMRHFHGRVREYVVINEPFRSYYGGGKFMGDIFQRVIGAEYIDIAFRAAREADPSASLVFNDCDNHSPDTGLTGQTQAIADNLKRQGLIDKVGMQMHIFRNGLPARTREEVVRTIQNYGVPAAVTEFDVTLQNMSGTQRERFIAQAGIYETMLGGALQSGLVKDLGFWGAADDESWLEDQTSPWGPPDADPDADPDMWDGDDKPKPAYYAVRKVLFEAINA